MLNAIFVGIRFVILVLSGHRHLGLENAALRQQLAVFKRDIKRPRLHRRGSIVLDWAEDDLEELEIRSGHRSTGNGDLMAAQTIQAILVAIISSKGPRTSTNEY